MADVFEFKDIEILQDIIKAGGFRAAAQKYNLSQSAISARVSGLEKKLGMKIHALLVDNGNVAIKP